MAGVGTFTFPPCVVVWSGFDFVVLIWLHVFFFSESDGEDAERNQAIKVVVTLFSTSFLR